jgi:cyclase
VTPGRVAAASLLLLAAGVARAADPAPAPTHFTLTPVGEGVYAAIAKEGDRASGANAGFVIGGNGVLVVDAFIAPAAAEELLREIRRLTPLPVRWVVNTHYHIDHVGGDPVFAAAGASIVAHENVRAWVRTENLKFFKDPGPQRNEVGKLPLPDVTHREGLSIWLGDRKVDVLARPGHTGGDSVVSVPSAGVVFAGDLFWRDMIPNLIDASTEPWIATLDGFLQTFPSATFVPGHGEIGKALEVRLFRDYLSGLRAAVARGVAEGKSGKELVDSILPAQQPRYGAWKLFDVFGPRNIELTEEEVRGTKKLPR